MPAHIDSTRERDQVRYLADHARLGPELSLHDSVGLVVDGRGRIVSVEPGTAASQDMVRLRGTVIPGLIDCHVHLSLNGGGSVVEDLAALSPEDVVTLAARNANAHLRSGVTTVRDLGSPDSVVLKLGGLTPARGRPRIIPAIAITSLRGHGFFIAREVAGVTQIREQVAAASREQARWLKVFATGGVLTPGTRPDQRQFDDVEMKTAVEAAHDLGIRVAAHAHALAGIVAAIEAGVDSVEHVSYLNAETAGRLAETASVAVSTLVATERFVRNTRNAPLEAVEKVMRHAPHERNALVALVQSGASMAAGTDAGTTHNPHGSGMVEQASLIVRAGATPMDALKAITVSGGNLLDIPAGQLTPGMFADWLVVAGDPGRDVEALRRIDQVFIGGEPVVSHVPE